MRTSLILLYTFFTCFFVGNVEAQPTKPIVPGQYGYLEIMAEHEGALLSLPSSIAMTLNFCGADTQWTALRVGSALGLNFDIQGRSPGMVNRRASENPDLFNGISLEQIQAAIKKMGYTWDRWQWPDDSTGFRNAINAIEQSLDARKPVIIDQLIQYASKNVGRTANHQALLAFGYDEKEGELLVMDPAMNFPGKRHIPFSELKKIWSIKGYYHALFTAPVGAYPAGHTQ